MGPLRAEHRYPGDADLQLRTDRPALAHRPPGTVSRTERRRRWRSTGPPPSRAARPSVWRRSCAEGCGHPRAVPRLTACPSRSGCSSLRLPSRYVVRWREPWTPRPRSRWSARRDLRPRRLARVPAVRPQVVLAGAHLREPDSPEMCRRLLAGMPDLNVLFIGVNASAELVASAHQGRGCRRRTAHDRRGRAGRGDPNGCRRAHGDVQGHLDGRPPGGAGGYGQRSAGEPDIARAGVVRPGR